MVRLFQWYFGQGHLLRSNVKVTFLKKNCHYWGHKYSQTQLVFTVFSLHCLRLLELDEGIEALDAAIEYRTESITSRQLEVTHSQSLLRVSQNCAIVLLIFCIKSLLYNRIVNLSSLKAY